MDVFNLEYLYDLAIKQREGLGTAYEYRVKLELLHRMVTKMDRQPKSVLIAGLPEKYGYGMDLVLFSQDLQAELTVLDERRDCLTHFDDLCQKLEITMDNHFQSLEILDWDNIPTNGCHDLVVSCEVLQRLNKAQQISYIRSLSQHGRIVAFFAPNAANKAHAKISGLEAIYLQELEALFDDNDLKLLDSGYIDAPPFPPGIKINHDENTQQHTNGLLGKTAMVVLDGWTRIERMLPNPIIKRVSHIIYAIGMPTLGP